MTISEMTDVWTEEDTLEDAGQCLAGRQSGLLVTNWLEKPLLHNFSLFSSITKLLFNFASILILAIKLEIINLKKYQ